MKILILKLLLLTYSIQNLQRKKQYQKRFDISGDRGDALEKAREATIAALNNGQFDNVFSEVIEDSKLLKTAKLYQVCGC